MRARARAAALAVLALTASAAAAPKEITDPEVAEFARKAASVSLSRGGVPEDEWRKGLADVATPQGAAGIDAAWAQAGYDPNAEARPRYLASAGTRADVRRVPGGRWTVSLLVAQAYDAKELSGARGLQVEVEVVLDPSSGRLAVDRLTAR